MDRIGLNKLKWTEWAKLDRRDQIRQNRLNMTELTKVDRMNLIELKWTKVV